MTSTDNIEIQAKVRWLAYSLHFEATEMYMFECLPKSCIFAIMNGVRKPVGDSTNTINVLEMFTIGEFLKNQ